MFTTFNKSRANARRRLDMSKDNGERLQKLAGFDAAKGLNLSTDLFQEVLEEVTAGRREEAKNKARELITEALSIREQMVKAERAFKNSQNKFNETLGKLLNRIESQMSPTAQPEVATELLKE